MYEEALIALLFVVFGFFEFFHPAEAAQGRAGRFRNLLFGAFALTVGAASASLIFSLLPIEIRQHHGLSVWQVLAYAGAYVVLADFLFYWYHRAQHRFRGLWAVHELHHSDTELNIFSSYRTYWLDYPIQMVLINAPVLYVLGFHGWGALAAVTIATFFLIFSHANLRLHLGWLTPVLVGPQLHRIHHFSLPEHRDKNLAQMLPVYDILFGTYYAPARDEFPPTGTPNLPGDVGFADSLARPFETWVRMLRKGRGSRPNP